MHLIEQVVLLNYRNFQFAKSVSDSPGPSLQEASYLCIQARLFISLSLVLPISTLSFYFSRPFLRSQLHPLSFVRLNLIKNHFFPLSDNRFHDCKSFLRTPLVSSQAANRLARSQKLDGKKSFFR